MKKTILLFVTTFLMCANLLAQKTWTGASSTSWNTATNWSPSGIPTAADNVTIPSAPANQPLLSGAIGACANLTINPGATLSISATTGNNATLTVTNSVFINGTLSIGGSIIKTGKLFANSVFWGSGSQITDYLNSSIEITENLEFSAGSNANFNFCSVQFTGSSNSQLTSNSSSSSLKSITLNKTAGTDVYINSASTSTLTINGSLTVNPGNTLISYANITTIFNSNIASSGSLNFSNGTQSFEKTSGTQVIQLNQADSFYTVKVNTGGTVTLSAGAVLNIKKHLIIDAGILNPAGNYIFIQGNWTNNVGDAGFLETNSRVIFSGGNFHQYCSNETFYILEVNKPLGGAFRMNGSTVTCFTYDWIAGAVDVLASGTFNALDLADDGIWGKYYVNPGCTINLYQDAAQRVDLGGDLTFTNGGTINVYGGSMHSHWPLVYNGSITMNAGTLDFKDQGILVYAFGGVSLTSNITGGTIRTSKGFFSNRSDFNPSGGTVELYGNVDENLQMAAGSLFDLKVNKGSTSTITVLNDLALSGSLLVSMGTLKAEAVAINTTGNITVQNGGTLWIDNGAQLKLGGTKILTIDNGGTLKSSGTSGSPNLITRLNTSANHHEFQVHGTLSSTYTTFEYNQGVNIWSDATIDPTNPMDNCTFRYGVDRYLLIANSQELMIRNVNFPVNAAYNNVWKNNNAGRINFRDASGVYAGAAYEQDPYNRVDWTSSQPGLWTGIVSSDWHTAGNWDDLNVPTSSVNVSIPTAAANMPLISSGNAACSDITVDGTLTIFDKTLNVGGKFNANGNLTMNNYLGKMMVQGNIQWNSGSTANITAGNIVANSDWIFNAGSNAILLGGNVSFSGAANKTITTNSNTSSFYDVYISKTGGASITASSTSLSPMRCNGFYVDPGCIFFSESDKDFHLKGNIYSFGTMQFKHFTSRVIFEGTDHLILPNSNDYFQGIVFNQTGTVTVNHTNSDSLIVKRNIEINSGIFSPGNTSIIVYYNWTNNAGTAGFDEDDSKVIFNHGAISYSSTEHFNSLSLVFPTNLYLVNGSNVSCNVLDLMTGHIQVASSSSFTANDLAAPGIDGLYSIWNGCQIELHQDAGQAVDLLGQLFIHGGDFRVYGGSEASKWGSTEYSTVYMEDGTLEFMDQPVSVEYNPPAPFFTDITGGTIRTRHSFTIHSDEFDPSGGTVEFYGNNNGMLISENGGYYHNVMINKDDAVNRILVFNTSIHNTFTVEKGLAEVLSGNQLRCFGDVNVNQNGWLALTSSTLKMAANKTININSGGSLSIEGYTGSLSLVTSIEPSQYYYLNMNDGSFFTVHDAIFEYLAGPGVNIASGVWVSPYRTLMNCIFRHGQPGSNALLTIENDQELEIEGAAFEDNSGCQFNVRKTSNQGSLTFINATGVFTGETFENDPNSRIFWTPNRKINLISLYLQGLYDNYGMMRQANDDSGPHWPAGVADQVTVEIHEENNYSNLIYTATDVPLNTDGTLTAEIPAIYQGHFWITVRHRNSIEITTSSAIEFLGGNVNFLYDSPAKVYGENLGYYNGRYVVYGGDVNQDGIVDGSDMAAIDNASTTVLHGYVAEDVNGDAIVDGSDMAIIDNNSTATVMARHP